MVTDHGKKNPNFLNFYAREVHESHNRLVYLNSSVTRTVFLSKLCGLLTLQYALAYVLSLSVSSYKPLAAEN